MCRLPFHETAGYPPLSTCLIWNVYICSLDSNQLCGVNWQGEGTFILDAINVLCNALTKSNVQSIR